MTSQSPTAFANLLVVLTLTVGGLGFVLVVAEDVSGQQPEAKTTEFFEPLKGEPNERIQIWGPEAAKFAKFEAEGLRVTLPAGHKGERPTGINTNLELKGDFEITVRYEIFQEPPPKAHDTASMKLILMAVVDRKQFNPIVLARIQTGPGEPKFSTYATLTDKETGQKKTKGAKQFPAQAKSGHLRMVRKGTVVSVFVKEEPEGQYQYLKEFPFPIGDDIKYVRVLATTGGEKSSLDVRFSDLRIRWAAPGNLIVAQPGVVAAEDDAAEQNSMRGWLIAGVLVGVVIIFLFAIGLGVALYVRRRSGAATART